ncbi:hypothetical protein R6G85_03370 [Actinotignum urinale]|uniref:Uncharacterized protein n=1 Tax=Actinotignum urinale TaxID=190146 RepID=A0AAW9HV22_9ACTO|nr:hypothetical protein [Actinotignum urinale]MDY5129758.1 hypothetical protein [Actinotignum urinale]MDY5133787.1 hypothetical protein [Actinotignum urinale]MDY5151530.1 hypothetical protein [Actinotignum urinale]MDY5155608.1 hypothetical protein [Actinotignum urinale]MDY5161115.1 hypothetical protein [Actinotignum urinale]
MDSGTYEWRSLWITEVVENLVVDRGLANNQVWRGSLRRIAG